MEEEDKVSVEIYHGKYNISKEDREPLYISTLAKYIDEKMNEIANTSHIVDSRKVAVLTALNIADELFKLKENKGISDERITKETKELVKLLDEVLKD